jgi:Protein kinase domain/PEGA domain
VLHQIGVGALGPVFRTYEPMRDRLVAVKVFRLDLTPEQASALADELARAAQAGLFHASIVEPLAAGLEGTVAYRAEEYVAAESLDVAMRHYAPAALDKALPFITQLAIAIDFARAAGVGHGALHPRDIFVTPDEARATGFGVVDALDRMGLRAPVRRPYSPPERIAGQPWGTPADVFSLGVIAFELLTGRRPSGLGDQMGPLTGAVLGARADAIKDVLSRAMQENPADRYSTAKEFAEALTQAAGAEAARASDRTEPAAPLDDFAAESEVRPPAESAREAVRKVIAARERKRQTQSKEKPPVSEPPSEPSLPPPPSVFFEAPRVESVLDRLTDRLPESLELPAQPVPEEASQAAEESKADSPAFEPPSLLAEGQLNEAEEAQEVPSPAAASSTSTLLEPPPRITLPPLPPLEGEPSKILEQVLSRDAIEREHVELLELRKEDASASEFVTAGLELEPRPFDDAQGRPEPVEDRVPSPSSLLGLGLSQSKAEPRLGGIEATDRESIDAPLLRDAHERVVAVDEFRARETSGQRPDRSRPRAPKRTPLERPAPVRSSPIDPIDADIPFVPLDDPQPDRPRIVMLPLAIVLILGLLLGYTAGYFVGSREQAAQQASVSPPATGTLSTPGTTGKSLAREFSEGAVGAAPTPEAARSAPAKPAAPPPAPTALRTGQIVVTSTPSKASVTVNGIWAGRTPLTLDRRPFGSYAVRVVQPGYETGRQTVSLSASTATRTLDFKLRPTRAARAPASAPPAAKPAEKPAAKPVGTTAKPSPPAATRGEIFVDSRPQGARVVVDGTPRGVTPLRLANQAAGSYVVRLELDDHQPWTATTRVAPGATSRVTGSLERIR